MHDSFRNLAFGLLFAAVLVYLLMLVNYQNFGDPFVVILALAATLCGIVTMLFITGTSLSVPPLMGAMYSRPWFCGISSMFHGSARYIDCIISSEPRTGIGQTNALVIVTLADDVGRARQHDARAIHGRPQGRRRPPRASLCVHPIGSKATRCPI